MTLNANISVFVRDLHAGDRVCGMTVLRVEREDRKGKLLRVHFAPTHSAVYPAYEHLQVERVDPDCAECRSIKAEGGFGPSHYGSGRCESGSLASGGQRAHCTCDTCF